MEKLNEARGAFRRILVLLAVFSFAVNMLMLTMPLYMLQIYDRILPTQSMATLTFLSIIAGGALIVLGLLEGVRGILATRAGMKLETMLGSDALKAGMIKGRMGEANVQPVRDLTQVRAFVSSRGVFALLDMPFAPIFIGILYFIHPILFWITVAGAVVLFTLAIFNQWVTSKPSTDASTKQGAAMLMANSVTQNAETLRAMGMTNNGIALWGEQNAQSLQAADRVDWRNHSLTGLSRTIRLGLQVGILGVGALLVLRGEMTAGMIFAASIISGRGLQPIDQVIGGWKQSVAAWRAWKSVEKILTEVGSEQPRTQLPPPKGEISVEGALVLGPGGASAPPILNRVNFKLLPGQVLGIIGPSGSGKSTLARLMVGAQRANAGTVRIDGTDIANWDPMQLGQHIGYLGQQVELLPGTIAANIARLDPQPDDAMVLEAAQKALVHELIQNLPNGYETRVGPGGSGLSGGQRQRIGLARAFYGNPRIMVLDEPNANLDDDGEIALHKALVAARESGVTIALITQRKQVLAAVDKVLRLHHGTIDFFGTREEFVEAVKKLKAQQQGGPQQKPAAQVTPPAAPSAAKTVVPQTANAPEKKTPNPRAAAAAAAAAPGNPYRSNHSPFVVKTGGKGGN